jgi:hypothetical protein
MRSARDTRGLRPVLILLAPMFLAAVPRADLQPAGRDPAFAAVSAGTRALAWNPANLSLLPRNGIEGLAIDASLGNSAYSLAEYNRFNGTYWGEEEKEEILAKIASDHITMAGSGSATVLGVTWNGLAVSTETRVLSRLRLPKELLRLLLKGNTVGQTFTLHDAEGGGLAFSELRLSGARPLSGVARALSLPIEHVHAGVSLKLLRGWGYAEVREAVGGVATTAETISGSGSLTTRQAAGGWGYGLDLGLSGYLGERWVASIAARDLIGRIRWARGVEERTDFFEVPEMDLGDIEEDLVQTGTHIAQGRAITANLPATVVCSTGYLTRWTTASLALDAPLRNGPLGRGSIGLSAGAAWLPRPWFALRTAGGFGGLQGTRLGAGFGCDLGLVAVDLAMRTWGTLNPFASRGLGLALSFSAESFAGSPLW